MIEVTATVALYLLAVAALLTVLRLVRGGSLPDRIVALDHLLVVIVCGLAVLAVLTKSDT
jgi:multicomponent Na+:H+ antiporter subunit F